MLLFGKRSNRLVDEKLEGDNSLQVDMSNRLKSVYCYLGIIQGTANECSQAGKFHKAESTEGGDSVQDMRGAGATYLPGSFVG